MSAPEIKLATTSRGVQILIKVVPRAAKPGVDGLLDGRLKLRLSSPPTDGRANAEALALLAEVLEVPKGNLELVAGAASRQKIVLVRGLSACEVSHRLEAVLEVHPKASRVAKTNKTNKTNNREEKRGRPE